MYIKKLNIFITLWDILKIRLNSAPSLILAKGFWDPTDQTP